MQFRRASHSLAERGLTSFRSHNRGAAVKARFNGLANGKRSQKNLSKHLDRYRKRIGRLDLRREENWCDEPSVCIECEIPDDQVVLSDFIAWHFVLNRSSCLIEQELDEALDLVIVRSSAEVAQCLKEATWPNIFNISKRPGNRWMGEVEDIQATFWELRREPVLSVRPCRVYKSPRL